MNSEIMFYEYDESHRYRLKSDSLLLLPSDSAPILVNKYILTDHFECLGINNEKNNIIYELPFKKLTIKLIIDIIKEIPKMDKYIQLLDHKQSNNILIEVLLFLHHYQAKDYVLDNAKEFIKKSLLFIHVTSPSRFHNILTKIKKSKTIGNLNTSIISKRSITQHVWVKQVESDCKSFDVSRYEILKMFHKNCNYNNIIQMCQQCASISDKVSHELVLLKNPKMCPSLNIMDCKGKPCIHLIFGADNTKLVSKHNQYTRNIYQPKKNISYLKSSKKKYNTNNNFDNNYCKSNYNKTKIKRYNKRY